MDLREYESAKFDLAEILRAIGEVTKHGREDLQRAVAELSARLAEDRFNLVVVGHFSRGKTTLMNAVMGIDRLPTGTLPLTSVITRVVYGSRERVQVEFAGAAIGFEVPMEALADYITERGNPGNERRIRAASIALPVEILRRGFCFVDTPGLGSATEENTRTTERFLPEADAVILVSAYDGPLTEDEMRVAGAVVRENRKLFLVLNKRDLTTPDTRREVDDYVRARLGEMCGKNLPRLFSLSAREGLVARIAGDRQASAASGVDDFEGEVTRFLIEDKNTEFLRVIHDRVMRLLEALESDVAVELRRRVAALMDRDSGSSRIVAPAHQSGEAPRTVCEHESSVRMEKCSICAEVAGRLFDFLRQYQYALVSDARERERFTLSGGLCGPHLWLYGSLASDRGVCVALAPLTKRLAAMLRTVAAAQPGARERELLDVPAECVLCRLETETERRVMSELAQQQDSCSDSDSDAPSLCLPHLRAFALQQGDGPATRRLAQRHSAAAERLAEDMERYVLKHDGLRRALASDEEIRAARRAIAFVGGYSAVGLPRRVR